MSADRTTKLAEALKSPALQRLASDVAARTDETPEAVRGMVDTITDAPGLEQLRHALTVQLADTIDQRAEVVEEEGIRAVEVAIAEEIAHLARALRDVVSAIDATPVAIATTGIAGALNVDELIGHVWQRLQADGYPTGVSDAAVAALREVLT